ncbi:unnamed protein product, partial [Chrysoparadoxa australica]
MVRLRLLRAEHLGAQRAWRLQGLTKYAKSASALAVAIICNQQAAAKLLMGLSPLNKRCASSGKCNFKITRGLFLEGCRVG